VAANRRRLALELAGLAAVVALAVAFGARRTGAPAGVTEHRLMMGTVVTVTVRSVDSDHAAAAVEAAMDEIARVEALTSRYSDTSEVARINRSGAAGGEFLADLEVLRIIARSLDVARASAGSFDATIGPLVDIWPLDEVGSPPDEADILTALSSVGYERVAVDTVRGALSVPPGTAFDLDGIAKGYAVDRALHVLGTLGVESAVVDAGGDVGFLGEATGGSWRVGVKHPRRDGLLGVLTLDGGSVATSGDYQRFAVIGGVRYHHILDPSTGWPARGVISATVTAPDALSADALATAVFVLGPEAGMRLIEETAGVEALIVVGDDTIEDVLLSSGLTDRFSRETGSTTDGV
jgi:thiamine biosynthesis lipoprotein